MAKRRILITGASGEITRQLLPTFRDRYDLVLLDTRPSEHANDIIDVDVSDPDVEKYREHFKGVDAIVCLSVNDAWVMHAWGESQNAAGKVMMIGDGGLEFTRWAGLEVDLSAKGYGARCKRFSALVEDGTVKTLHFEDGGFGETSAERLLEDL